MNRKINILTGGSHECCGVLCPKQEVQEYIDRMQLLINRADLYFQSSELTEDEFESMVKSFRELSSR